MTIVPINPGDPDKSQSIIPTTETKVSELEERLMQIKVANRKLEDKIRAATLIKTWFNDPSIITVEGDIDSGQEIAARISVADYFHICELLGLPTDSTPQERLDLEIDEMLDSGLEPEES